MFTKEWIGKFDNHTIRVVNSWDFKKTIEEVYIDDEQKIKNESDLSSTIFSADAMGKRWIIEYNGHKIEILGGQAWHFMGTACKILVDGKQVGGNRIVLLVPKQAA